MFDLILADASVMMNRRSGSGVSTLDCLGSRLVPAHFWPPVSQKAACTNTSFTTFPQFHALGVVCTIVTLRHNVLFAFALSEKEMLKQVVSVVNFISSWTQCIGMVTITTGYT